MSAIDAVKNAVGLGDKDEADTKTAPAKKAATKTAAKTASRKATTDTAAASDTKGSTNGGRDAHATPTSPDAAKNGALATEVARASSPLAAAAAAHPDTPIASGLIRHGAAYEDNPEKIERGLNPLVGTEYAANAIVSSFEAHFKFTGDVEKTQAALEKVLGDLEGGNTTVTMAELRHGSASNPQVEALVSPKRRKEMEQEAKTSEANARKVAEDTRKELESRRAAALDAV